MQSFPARSLKTAIVLLFLITNASFSQSFANISLDEIIRNAAEQRNAYVEEFKNLLSQETKTFEIYDKKGQVKKRRLVVSNFIVFQLENDDKRIAEYRNIVSVDGKQLNNTDKRAQDFFEQITKAGSSQKQLEKLDMEGSRFDEEISLSLFTLYQSVSLAENLRPFFEFKLDGKETLAGGDVYVLSYQQVKESPYIITNAKKEPVDGRLTLKYDVDFNGGRDVNPRLLGKYWIDANTFQVWREQRVLTLQPKGFSAPVVFAENVFEFQKSDFGILTPKKISYTQYRLEKKDLFARKEASVNFEYDKFTKPDVEVNSGEVK